MRHMAISKWMDNNQHVGHVLEARASGRWVHEWGTNLHTLGTYVISCRLRVGDVGLT